jgi:hypothetical protein
LNPTARFSGKLGLPRRNPSDYWEYRPLSLAIGVRATGSQLVRIGAGDGPGSGRLKIDLGSDEAEIRVLQTGGSAEGSVPACLLTISNSAAAFIQHDGDSGLAFFPEDAATIGSLDVRGGSFSTGDNVTIEGAVTAIVGSVRGRYLDASGNSHRWE